MSLTPAKPCRLLHPGRWGVAALAGWLCLLSAASANQSVVAELDGLLASTPESAPELLRWMIRNNQAFHLELPADGAAEPLYSHPLLEPLRRRARTLDWRPAVGQLSLDEQYQLFRMQRPPGASGPIVLHPVDFVPAPALFTDDLLLHVIGYLVDHPLGARYDGVGGVILYSDPLLEHATEFIWRFPQENPEGFRRTINRLRHQPIYERLMINTFNENPQSQLEPYDHLCARLQSALYAQLTQATRQSYISRVGLKRFYRQYTDIVFGYPPSRDPAPPVAFGHNGDPETRTFDFLCAGGLETIEMGEPIGSPPGIRWMHGDLKTLHVDNRFIERVLCVPVPGYQITYGVLDLRPDLDKQDVQLYLRCATGVYALNFEVEQGEGVLPPASDRMRLDQAKATGEMTVVTSFGLFPEVTNNGVADAMKELVRLGYYPIAAPTVVADLWDDFVKEASRPTTSLVMPIYHVLDQERIRLGWNNARKIVLARKVGGEGPIRRIRAVVYTPSPGVAGEEVVLHQTEFGRLFEDRVASPVRGDTLCLMNMSCYSQYSVESWMAAFREAVRGKDLAEVDPREIPFIIGAKKGFDTRDPFALLAIVESLMDSLSADQTRPQILEALLRSGLDYYEPMTNLNRPNLLRMGGSFRLHVSRAGHAGETVSF